MKNQKSDILPKEIDIMLSSQGLMRLDGLIPDGTGVFGVRDHFSSGKIYKTVGITFEVYSDGSKTLCWILMDDDAIMTIRAADNFVEVKDYTPIDDTVKKFREENKATYEGKGVMP
jgi:hypothetical protein